MKIELDTLSAEQNRIESYSDDSVVINGETYSRSLIITPDKLVTDWQVTQFTDLASQHVEAISELDPEIIIIGTGSRVRFPDPQIIADVFNRNIGLEVMDTGAACRCYNLLASEERRVAAGLIIPCDA